MKNQYAVCNNVECCKEEACPKKFKIMQCMKNSQKIKYSCNNAPHNSNKITMRHYGISKIFNEFIEQIIYDHSCKPK